MDRNHIFFTLQARATSDRSRQLRRQRWSSTILCTQGSPERFLRLTQKIPISLSGAKVEHREMKPRQKHKGQSKVKSIRWSSRQRWDAKWRSKRQRRYPKIASACAEWGTQHHSYMSFTPWFVLFFRRSSHCRSRRMRRKSRFFYSAPFYSEGARDKWSQSPIKETKISYAILCTQRSQMRFPRLTQKVPISLSGAKVETKVKVKMWATTDSIDIHNQLPSKQEPC